MKKLVSLFLALTLLTGVIPFVSAEGGHPFFTRSYSIFATKNNIELDNKWPLYFTEDAEDMPWIDLEELADLLNMVQNVALGNEDFHLDYAQEGKIITLTRENTFWMRVDFENNAIFFNDYDAFVLRAARQSLLDQLSFTGFDEKGEAALFQRDALASYDRYGDMMALNLSDYKIQLVMDEDRGYIPLQTVNDFLIAPLTNRSLLFNGESLFLANGDDMFDQQTGGLSALATNYFSAAPATRSQKLADFGVNELTLMLDCQYGLKQKHGIDSFAQIFWQIGFDEALASASPVDADSALRLFISYYLDDQHSGFGFPSWMTGMGADLQEGTGPSVRLSERQEKQYQAARSSALGEQFEPYQEIQNTAYITFDRFDSDFEAEDYYKATADGKRVDDTIGLIVYAHQQISRKDSPIENVVIDLSCNGGGSADAALFVISWILGEAEVSVENAFTGAQSTMVYRADVNMDHQFDENDTLQGKHVYCLISPNSFSCGNLVPAVCKANQAVTLIGRTSGGGACEVQQRSTAWGTTFQISGSNRLSFRKNGSFYDIDEGVAPDVYLSRIETFYDRQKLNDLINNLP